MIDEDAVDGETMLGPGCADDGALDKVEGDEEKVASGLLE